MIVNNHVVPDEQSVNDFTDEEELDRSINKIHSVTGPTRVIVHPLDVEGGQRYEFTHDGSGDKVVAEVARRYAPQMSNPDLRAEDRRRLSLQMMHEIAETKHLQEMEKIDPMEANVQPVHPLPAVPQSVPVVKPVGVNFDFGELGSFAAVYDLVTVAGGMVILASRLGSSGTYVPPVGKWTIVQIEGYLHPLQVILVGAAPFNGFNQVVLLINVDD